MCHSARCEQLIMDRFAHSQEFSIGTIAWPRQADRQDFPNGAWLRRHDDNPICKIYRFLDVVRDQHDRRSLSLPNSQDFLLHAHSSQSIQGREWFVQ